MNKNPQRKPSWLTVPAFNGAEYQRVNKLIQTYNLKTVCQAANCPNRGECFNRGTATFLLLGPNCSRNCGFCDVDPGRPLPVEEDEPKRVADMAAVLKLKHVVVTSVTRDDLVDGGAAHFAETVKCLRQSLPKATVELLVPDFQNKAGAVDTVLKSKPDILNHNMETVSRLYPEVRPKANYQLSLDLLNFVAVNYEVTTKSGIMVGLGETVDELKHLFGDMADSAVSLLTIGQYLAPSQRHLPVCKYYHPDEFDQLKELALEAGLKKVFSAPLVRSSYKAELI